MPRRASDDRLQRILAVVPWVAANDGPTVDEVVSRFDYRSPRELQQDLDLLFLCGVPPYTPDSLIEVDLADGRVWINYADWFARPLRLTPAEALTLVAASAALLEAAGDAGSDGPLARGLAKLAGALGVAEEAIDVALGAAPALDQVMRASQDHHQVEIEYYGYGRDEVTTRVIDPHLVYSASAQWYVAGFCHLAGADRIFRADRIRRVEVLATTFEPRPPAAAPPRFAASAEDPVITLDLEPDAAWVSTQYPVESVEDLGQGRQRVTLRVAGDAWLARLLIRLGPSAAVVAGDPSAAGRYAARMSVRYAKPVSSAPQ